MNELIILIDRLLKKILAETLEIKTEKSDCQKFYYENLFVNIRLFEGAVFLLREFKESPHLQVSFISIMRDIISNLILAEYIHQKESDSSAKIEEELEKVYSEHYRYKKKTKKIESILSKTFEDYVQFEEYFYKLREKNSHGEEEMKPHLKTTESTYSRIRYIESRLKKDKKPEVITLLFWYNEFSKIAHFGELTVLKIAHRYYESNEKQVYKNYGYLLITVAKNIYDLYAKVLYPDELEKSIVSDFEKILEFENDI